MPPSRISTTCWAGSKSPQNLVRISQMHWKTSREHTETSLLLSPTVLLHHFQVKTASLSENADRRAKQVFDSKTGVGLSRLHYPEGWAIGTASVSWFNRRMLDDTLTSVPYLHEGDCHQRVSITTESDGCFWYFWARRVETKWLCPELDSLQQRYQVWRLFCILFNHHGIPISRLLVHVDITFYFCFRILKLD